MKNYNLNKIFDLSGNNSELKNIAKIQQDGIKMALKILENRRYVLIADDVGMGKTYEGLGILFYKMVENNRIGKGMNVLIVAPSNEVAEKWNTEIKSFKTNCLKKDVEIIDDDNYYLRKIINNNNKKLELRKKRKVESDKNYLTIINLKNFSRIEFNKDADIEDTVKQLMEKSKKLPNYDLVIIDESQNLRRHESNRSRCFSALFQLNNKINSSRNYNFKLSDKFKEVVLLSATPNHSSKNDITSQVQYFEPIAVSDNNINTQIITDIKNIDKDIKNKKFIIKRYREYDGKKKYEFRQFEAYNTENMKFIEMLTMALIQKNQIKNKNGVFKMGYLDGFESFISSQNNEDDENSDYYLKEHWNLNEDNKTKEKYYIDDLYNEIKDYTEKTDLDIHNVLTHPKPRCIKDLLLDYNELSYLIQKCLIFVRRVSSIEEIEKQLIKKYDNEITKFVNEATKSKIKSLNDLIAKIDKKLKKDNTFEYQNNDLNDDNKNVQEENEFEDDENNETIKSEWLKQLELKKDLKTSFSKVKLKFHTGEDYNYYDFFEPKILNSFFEVSEIKNIYLQNKIKINEYILSYQANLKEGKMRNYHKLRAFTAGFLEFFVQNENDKKQKFKNILDEYISVMKLKKVDSNRKNELSITNLEEFYISFLEQKNFWDCKEFKENGNLDFINKSNKDLDFELFKKQIRIKKIIEKNLLNSEGMIYLLTVLSEIKTKYIYQIKTKDIIDYIENDKSIFHKKIMNRIKEFILNYTKEEKIIQNLNIEKCFFKSPIAGTSGKVGSSKRVRIQSLFNTSFYPDIIISTDIFNEGIDLHLFCSRIIHYGIAWLPGDMEQRIGRIDRLFCKGYRDYEDSKKREENGNCKQIKIDFIHMDDEMDKRQISKILERMIEAIKELEVLDAGEKNKEVDCNEERNEIKEKIDILNKIGENL